MRPDVMTRKQARIIRTRVCVSPAGPTARPIPAQGNALGMVQIFGEPCRGDPIDRPYRAHIYASHSPGRCPGLGWVRAVGPVNPLACSRNFRVSLERCDVVSLRQP